MIKTPIDQNDILYQRLTGSSLDAALTGNIYPNERPNNSLLEDAVINGINTDTEQFQNGRSNVNIYVPSLIKRINGATQLVPDRTRLKVLQDMALFVLEEQITPLCQYWISGISDIIAEPETKSHYVNLRIDFTFFPS